MPTKRKDPREKYDVSGLPPMPTKLRPLVMPVRGLRTNAPNKACGVEAITATIGGLKLADTQDRSRRVAVLLARQTQDDLSEDECDMTIAVMRQGENDTKRKFNWADQCDSDVEDDEF